MKTITLEQQLSEDNRIEMIDFYNEATEDYKFWSHDYNMHFGYFIPFKTNPFKRDTMLNQMNAQVIKRLGISSSKNRLIDLGCGMGATMRYALKQYTNVIAYGVTLSDFQLKQGNKLLQGKNGIIIKENYNDTSFQTNAFDSAVAIESFCHSGHSSLSLKEAHRILKPGGRLVIADAFLKKDKTQLCKGAKHAYQNLCNHWSLEQLANINDYKQNLKNLGFTTIKIEDASFKVAPSVLHVPFAIIGFILKKLLRFKSIKRESLHNLKGSFYALFSGLHMKSFGYYIITATKN
ncbi:methyltransferase domain-containing protein [Psychroserpens sp. SPM9]|uniref:methyltransferase domain-containing protein n=1 Tax=Psychroserpens sp. SPM9 TaxID=2975598 RepID=UPI0021A6A761|nr:methyltransferase domain-containing protein [Psychroserpens sp. SPM9]MDG5492513.1 methyltransferase domain-containing protein [Psychroserpens sp. SPM9]